MVEAAAQLRYTCHVLPAIGRFRRNTQRTQQMNEFEQYPAHSPLCQDVTRDGKTVRVEIYEDGKGGWILEVVDQNHTSTVWDDSFPSDQAALDEALRTIDDEGISPLIGDPPHAPASGHPSGAWQGMAPLSDEELDELDDFLASDACSDETMLLDTLDGYLTAIVSGPVLIKPSEWLPRVWGPTARDEPAFDTHAQAERIIVLIMRHMNGIIWRLQVDPDLFEPILSISSYPGGGREYQDGEMWANGYMMGLQLRREHWKPFFDDPDAVEALRPIRLLGADDVTPEEEALTETPAQREALSGKLAASVSAIYRFWLPYREAVAERTVATTFQRQHPKVGRNDPCPCGSGKKFKKCCGAAGILH